VLKIKRALISVYNKTGLLDFANTLRKYDVEIISTGGTYKHLLENGIKVTSISDVTGFPEILDGRVKTLHPKIHAGILAILENPKHLKEINDLGINPIDLVCINLYPFEETAKNPSLSQDEIIEQIDIGGPSMLRAASKNYKYTLPVSDPAQYDEIINEMNTNNGAITEKTCFVFAREVFRNTSYYDSLIFDYFNGIERTKEKFPDTLTFGLRRDSSLRYGENPHQEAALYGNFSKIFKKLHGKELSYNNILDISSAISLLLEFEEPCSIIVKHNNPCGVGIGDSIYQAYERALSTDPKSAFGGIIALNQPLDLKTAELIHPLFSEVLITTGYSDEVLDLLKKKKDRRIMVFEKEKFSKEKFQIKNVIGGALVQDIDDNTYNAKELSIPTKRQPTDKEMKALIFGWKVAKHVKSNAIVFCNENQTLGIGAGQMSRIDSTKIAIMKAKESGLDLNNSSVASDAYFPFADSMLEAVNAGATSVIQPGGSIRDNEVIEAADKSEIAMVFTKIRHFKH
jgi:phosphoribosylaminoimidazolecarboxamide formyltransferase/IMP cyclohydrolase